MHIKSEDLVVGDLIVLDVGNRVPCDCLIVDDDISLYTQDFTNSAGGRSTSPMLINDKEKNPFRKISIFKNIRYKWGGKSFKGIDCSALIQIFLNFNNKFCPRDAKDQVKFFKKKAKCIKKNINLSEKLSSLFRFLVSTGLPGYLFTSFFASFCQFK